MFVCRLITLSLGDAGSCEALTNAWLPAMKLVTLFAEKNAPEITDSY